MKQTHVHVPPSSDHVNQLDVVDIAVGEWLINLLVLPDALLEVLHRLHEARMHVCEWPLPAKH